MILPQSLMGMVHFFWIFIMDKYTALMAAWSSGNKFLDLVNFLMPLLRLSITLVV